MLKSYGGWWVVAYRILVSAPVPLVLIGFLNWFGLGFGDKVLGTGLDNLKRKKNMK